MADFPLPHQRKIDCSCCGSAEITFEHHERSKVCPVCTHENPAPSYQVWVKYDDPVRSGEYVIDGTFPTYEEARLAGKAAMEESYHNWTCYVVAPDGTKVG